MLLKNSLIKKEKRQTSYVVSIPHREPTYDLRRGESRKEPFLTSFEVVAESQDEAVQSAIELFEQLAHDSQARWARVIDHQGITVIKKKDPS